MSSIFAKLKLVWDWAAVRAKMLLTIFGIVVLTILIFWWARKNQKIRSLENQLFILNAKLKIQAIQARYNATLEELRGLKEKDDKLNKEIVAIDASLSDRLKSNMTADEIAAKFKEIGIR
jgi:hypothetical protein